MRALRSSSTALAVGLFSLCLVRTAQAQGTCAPPLLLQLTHSSGLFKPLLDEPAVNGTGSVVAYVEHEFGPGALYRLNPATGMAEFLCGTDCATPWLDNSGDRLVYEGDGDPFSYFTLKAAYLRDFTKPPDMQVSRIAGGSNAGNAIRPQISADGKRVAFISYLTTANGIS